MGSHLADAKKLTGRFKKGTKNSAKAFRELVQLWLTLTVLKEGEVVHCTSPKKKAKKKAKDVFFISGMDSKPLRLRNGRYLWLSFNLVLEDSARKEGPKRLLKVVKSAAWYAMDRACKRLVFRYEYIRTPDQDYPYSGSHLHVHGTLDEESVLPENRPLYKVHFPASRVPLEAIIRLLIEDFGVPPRDDEEVWRPVLAWTEEEFRKIAHEQVSGPAR